MNADRETYVNRVVDRLRALLDAQTQLPCQFRVSGGWAAQSDFALYIYLEPETPYEGVFEGEVVFAGLQQRLNDEFRSNPWYCGIGIGVPHRFLGQRHMDELHEQDEDNKRYRQIRLSTEDKKNHRKT